MKKRMISIFLSLLLLTGCTGGNGGGSTTEPVSADLPEYTAGVVTRLEYDAQTVLTRSLGSTYAQFEKYCADMARAGYEKLYSRDTQDLRCEAFLDAEHYIYAYYTKQTGEVRVIRGPKDTFSTGDCREDTGVTANPSLTMIGQQANRNNGQGFVFVLPDGRLILQDGGNWFADLEPDLIYNAIKTVAPDPENIVIAAWFISHPHSDHIGAFLKFVTDYAHDETIRLQRVIHGFAGSQWYDFERADGTVEESGHYVLEMYELLRTKLPDTQVIRAMTGQVFDFGTAQVEILHSVEDQLPAEDLGYINSSSMVIRVHIAGQTVLLLADTTSATAPVLIEMYGESLSSDVVQLAHHGMWAGSAMLYFYSMAPVLLWPTLPSVAVDWLADKPAMAAIEYASDIYIAGTGLTTLALPYSIVGNKQAVIADLSALK